jgi:hypothetical protein
LILRTGDAALSLFESSHVQVLDLYLYTKSLLCAIFILRISTLFIYASFGKSQATLASFFGGRESLLQTFLARPIINFSYFAALSPIALCRVIALLKSWPEQK